MSQPLPPDPRIGKNLKYDRKDIIACVTDFYEAMIKLPHIDPTDLLYPPTEGWSSITKSSFAPLRKSDEVIELLRHLPYLKCTAEQVRGNESIIAWDTKQIDYREARFQPDRIFEGKKLTTPIGDGVPEWVVPLTKGVDNYGTWLMLDTSDGEWSTATDYRELAFTDEPDYAPDDPRHWRDLCEGETRTLRGFLGQWKERFMNLEWICVPSSRFQMWFSQNAEGEQIPELKELQDIFWANGWPNRFDRDACKKALDEWDAQRPA